MNPLQEKISPSQMAVLFLSMLLGSAIVYIPAPIIKEAQNASWLTIVMGGAYGLLLLTCIMFLYRRFPEQTFLQAFRSVFGNVLTWLFAVPFIGTLLFDVPLIVQGLGAFFTDTMMVDTPAYVFNATMLLTAALTVKAGIEVMARLFTVFLSMVVVTVFCMLLFAIPMYDAGMLLPQFPEGFKPVLRGAYSVAVPFPYSETMLFGMMLCYTARNHYKQVRKYMYQAIGFNVAVFILVLICTVMVFGAYAGERKYSLYEFARVIELTGLFERMESLIGIILLAGSYMKTTVVLFVLNLAVAQLLQTSDRLIPLFPISIICFWLSNTMFPTEDTFVESWTIVWPLLSATTFSLPLFMMTIACIRKKPESGGIDP